MQDKLEYRQNDYFKDNEDHEFLVFTFDCFHVAHLSFERGYYWLTYTVGESMADLRRGKSNLQWMERVTVKASTVLSMSL